MSRTENHNILERISTGIYFITSFFDDKEPLKWKLRALAINFVSYDIKDKSWIFKETTIIFSIAKNAGLISEDNYEIFISRLLELENKEKIPLEMGLPKQENIKDKIMSLKKNNRQETILSIFNDKKEATIKDISSFIKGCSTKTIQRELSNMVKIGILKKYGEKRWSRYGLA